MNRRQRRRRRADHRPLRPVNPPMAIAILCELLGCCPSCDAPITVTPSGMYLITHEINCQLAADVGRAA